MHVFLVINHIITCTIAWNALVKSHAGTVSNIPNFHFIHFPLYRDLISLLLLGEEFSCNIIVSIRISQVVLQHSNV